MATIVVAPGKLGATIRADANNARKLFHRGAKRAAHKGRTALVRRMPVDLGVLKNAWEVKPQPDWAPGGALTELVNTAPYAGVIERGARPGATMSREGIEALAGWVRRKILKAPKPRGRKAIMIGPATPTQNARAVSLYDQSIAIAYAIAAKFKRDGRVGKFHVLNSLELLVQFAFEEIMREINKYYNSGGGTHGNI